MFFYKDNMGRRAPLLFLLLFTLVLLPLSSATKVVVNPAQGVAINTWEVGTVKQNEAYNIVWDSSDIYGRLLNNTQVSCIFFLQRAGSGIPLVSGNGSTPPGDSKSWYVAVPGYKLAELGRYNYQIDCFMKDNVSISGNALSSFDVTPDGQPMNTGAKVFIMMFLLSITILILGFMFKNHIFSFIAGLSLMVTGVYTMIYGFSTNLIQYPRMIALIILGLGIIITIISAWELIKETSGEEKSYDEEEGDE